MVNNEKILQDIVRSTQMGQSGIDAVLDKVAQPTLRLALKSQRKEYGEIQHQAEKLASQKGCAIQTAEPLTDKLAAIGARGKLLAGDKDAKIAGMMILGSTRGMIQSRHNLHACKNADSEVTRLVRKLLETEDRNIRQMEPYL